MKTLFLSSCLWLAATAAYGQGAPGRQLYESRCGRCHGADGTGGESGPNIVARIDARSDADLAQVVSAGRPASGMPPAELPPPEMQALIAHLRTLVPFSREARPAAVRRTVETVDGRTIDGRVLNEGIADLQVRSDDQHIHLLRKDAGGRVRRVTS